jgi:RNA polymerase sigma factor FliA
MILSDDDSSVERMEMLESEERDVEPELAAMRSQAHDRLRDALEGLPERDRQVAVLVYVYNLTLREIGEVLGVTESRVCQIHSALKNKLRRALSADEQLFQAVA